MECCEVWSAVRYGVLPQLVPCSFLACTSSMMALNDSTLTWGEDRGGD